MVIISLLRIAGPVISPLLAKYPNDSRADIQCHANSLTTSSCQPSVQGSSQKTDILFSNSAHTAATGSELKMMKIKFFELF